MKKLANTEVQIDKLISERWSPRAFDPNFLINDKSIKSLMEAARWAPSCFGDQPWRFILFEKSDATFWTKALNCLSVGNQNWAMDSSLLIVDTILFFVHFFICRFICEFVEYVLQQNLQV